MSASEFRRWERYFNEEPFGVYRDNLHAALICREISRPYLKEGSTTSLQDFMILSTHEREAIERKNAEAHNIAFRTQLEFMHRLGERKKRKLQK